MFAFAQGTISCISAHLVLVPAAAATSECVKLMGVFNRMRYRRDEAGLVTIAEDHVIIQAECLSTYVRETNEGQGMGLYLPVFGKVTNDKIARVASTLATIITFLAQAAAPAEEWLEQDVAAIKHTGEVLRRQLEQCSCPAVP